MTDTSGLRNVLLAIGRDRLGKCRVCGHAPRVTIQEYLAVEGVTVTARCHGSIERKAVKWDDDGGADFSSFREWCENVFALDAKPDVAELIRYNRGGWPSDHKRHQPLRCWE